MIVTIIPAKGGSTRLPNKNMTIVNGKPLLAYSIEWARNSKQVENIFVSTDSDEIESYCNEAKVAVIRRPESLGGDVPIIEVYRHAIENINDGDKVQSLIGLQPDHPDRDLTIDETLNMFLNEDADRLMSTESDGTKNGAHYILSRHFIDTETSRKDIVVVDDCTNIHFQEDLERASKRLLDRA
jgi:CMP-N-acetylneuraminic acid synthetase